MKPVQRGRIAIVGAGPCGLACATELERLGHHDWALYERTATPGGLASSVVDPAGFTWDLGGHVVFSHFGEFDRLLAESMGDEVVEHERSSYVHFEGRWVPYPFQNNLRYLPKQAAYECLAGLFEAPGANGAVDFATWMERTLGTGITRHFMRPYNLKVWAHPPESMSATWIAERVSVVDARRALRSVVLDEDDLGWGPNNTFRFPREGGTGEIYRRLAAPLAHGVSYGRELVSVDVRRRELRFDDGTVDGYDALVSTMPLDLLVGALSNGPPDVRAAAGALAHNGVRVVGVGVERPLADTRSWLYFPSADVPFYRVTNFAKYAAANVPQADTRRYSSFLTETAYSGHRPLTGDIEEAVVRGLVSTGLLEQDTKIVSVHAIDIPYAYPVPTLGRDAALATIQPWLRARDILSVGRFGAWRYENGNMDHAAKMGIDAARYLVEGRPEELEQWAA